jgi:DNA (cytosine-5)-methyltransferase 1
VTLRYLSLFAGIEGIGRCLEAAGMRCVGQVEIDKFCNKVLARRYPDVPRWPDVRTFGRDGPVPAADVVCGGVPCQDLSVAGKRAGLGGARSGLFFEFVRIADLVAPTWVLFENVPGLLSSKQAEAETDTDEPEDALSRYHAGEDFAVVLGELTGFRPAVPADGWRTAGLCIGPKRSAAWRVLDAQYFGVAQRRRRVFVVCHARAEIAGAVLLEREGGEGNPPPVREPWEDPAGELVPGVAGALGSHRSPRFDTGNSGAYIPEVAYAVRSSQKKQNGSPERGDVTLVAMAVDGSDVANTLKRDDATTVVATSELRVRRLTVTEQERLQGFPDGWTCLCGVTPYSSETCVCPDGPRVAAIGNAVAVPCAAWIGRRLVERT